jgi:hypothetical protein
MNPRIEAKTLKSLDDAITHLEQLRPYLSLAFARSDENVEKHDRKNDIIGKTVRKLSNRVIAIDIAAASLIETGQMLEQPEIEQQKRQASVPNCVACDELALPRPKRGMCQVCFDAFNYWSKKQADPDIAVWIRSRHSEETGGTGIIEGESHGA